MVSSFICAVVVVRIGSRGFSFVLSGASLRSVFQGVVAIKEGVSCLFQNMMGSEEGRGV